MKKIMILAVSCIMGTTFMSCKKQSKAASENADSTVVVDSATVDTIEAVDTVDSILVK